MFKGHFPFPNPLLSQRGQLEIDFYLYENKVILISRPLNGGLGNLEIVHQPISPRNNCGVLNSSSILPYKLLTIASVGETC